MRKSFLLCLLLCPSAISGPIIVSNNSADEIKINFTLHYDNKSTHGHDYTFRLSSKKIMSVEKFENWGHAFKAHVHVYIITREMKTIKCRDPIDYQNISNSERKIKITYIKDNCSVSITGS